MCLIQKIYPAKFPKGNLINGVKNINPLVYPKFLESIKIISLTIS